MSRGLRTLKCESSRVSEAPAAGDVAHIARTLVRTMEGYKRYGDVRGATRQIVQLTRNADLKNGARASHSLTVCVDEGAQSSTVWSALKGLVSRGVIAGASGLRHELWLDRNGVPISPDFASMDPWKRARTSPGARRIHVPDKQIALGALARLYSHRRVVLLSEDLGEERDSLRWLLRTRAAPEFDPAVDLGLTLLLNRGAISHVGFGRSIVGVIEQTTWTRGYSEMVLG
jgi:hypothetical protein